ncbi:AAA family ATPase [Halocatena pleomorpha]|uniref:MoxR family ATPase n=1 Tax=Halocatena pleomorpha TaxID=1785090 RepID=A0A3P3RL26_9EURY|nr:MoxR family ATPase [Halocatena pleomorpha]RRJ33598.1 MoxR family ATPase [Halocatena pleomorpha]
MEISDATARCDAVLEAIETAVIADREVLETVLVGLLARGHVLLEDVPGTGKTLTARSMATALGLSFSRIQFTPDLLPADITGTHVFNEQDRTFEFSPGPIFTHILLADEINRAPPKTQAALLEAMEEGQVTVDGETHALPDPFFVIATQNPIDMEGTFALPEAQVDRFMIKASLGYPDTDGAIELLDRRLTRDQQTPSVQEEITTDHVRTLQSVPESVHVDSDLLAYIVAITEATRQQPHVSVGVSPRGTQRLLEATRAYAVLQGRKFVTPDDIKTLVPPVLAHRLVRTPEAAVEELSEREIVQDILTSVPVPTV